MWGKKSYINISKSNISMGTTLFFEKFPIDLLQERQREGEGERCEKAEGNTCKHFLTNVYLLSLDSILLCGNYLNSQFS